MEILLEGVIGEWVVVRDNLSGVWLGRLHSATGSACRLAEARKCWWWDRGTGETSALAARGPRGDSKIGPQVETTLLFQLCEINLATPEAVAAWRATPVWLGDNR